MNAHCNPSTTSAEGHSPRVAVAWQGLMLVALPWLVTLAACQQQERGSASRQSGLANEVISSPAVVAPFPVAALGEDPREALDARFAELTDRWRTEPGHLVCVPQLAATQGDDAVGSVVCCTYTASSTAEGNVSVQARAPFDGDPATVWAPAATDTAAVPWVAAEFDSPWRDDAQLKDAERDLASDENAPSDAFVWRPRAVGLMLLLRAPDDSQQQDDGGRAEQPIVGVQLLYRDQEGRPARLSLSLRARDRGILLFDLPADRQELLLFGRCRLVLSLPRPQAGTGASSGQAPCAIAEARLVLSDGR